MEPSDPNRPGIDAHPVEAYDLSPLRGLKVTELTDQFDWLADALSVGDRQVTWERVYTDEGQMVVLMSCFPVDTECMIFSSLDYGGWVFQPVSTATGSRHPDLGAAIRAACECRRILPPPAPRRTPRGRS